jgi:hypothetical protein
LIVLILSPSVFDGYGLIFDISGFGQASAERCHKARIRRRVSEEPNHRHRLLLRARGERPSRNRTAEKCDELAPSVPTDLHPLPLARVAA